LAYLEQLVGELRRAHLVEGTRGLHGGYRLSRTPGEITVGQIYRVLEGPIAPVECTAENYLPGACDVESGCLSRSVWTRVQESILQVLDSTTLADLQPACAMEPRLVHLENSLDMVQDVTDSLKVGCGIHR